MWSMTWGCLIMTTGCLIINAPEDSDAAMADVEVDVEADVNTLDVDAGPPPCGSFEHRCDGVCVMDSTFDEPSYGCRNACPPNTACAEPEEGMRVYCDDGHQCAYEACATCESRAAQCGLLNDGCGETLDCGMCDPSMRCDGDFACVACSDGQEPSTESDPYHLGTESDIPDSTVIRYATLHDETDEDWYSIQINDRSPRIVPGGGPPNVTVTVSDLPAGITPTLDVRFACDDGTLSYSCGSDDTNGGGGRCSDTAASGENSVSVFHDLNCLPNDGDDADGRMWIRVASVAHPGASLCGPYQLRVRVQ